MLTPLQRDEGERALRILIVDDEPGMHESYRQCFKRAGGGQDSALDTMAAELFGDCLLYTSPSPRDLSTSRMPSSA